MKIISLALLTGALSFIATGSAMAYEEPKYQVIMSDPQSAIEIRQYAPFLIAQVTAEGDMDEASSRGFRMIADYIFGNNRSNLSTDSEKIAMTTPVTIAPISTKIEMTIPVTIEPTKSETNLLNARSWQVHFVMPSQYTLSSIPKPNNNAVLLREVPEKYFAVLKYSGFNTISNVQSKTDELLHWLQSHQLQIKGAPQLARYNPPWSLPMFRRNEIMIEIGKPETLK